MSCQPTIDRISAWVDDEASAAEHAEIEAHVANCADCAARVQAYRALKHGIGSLPARVAPPAAVRARVEALRFRRRSLPRRSVRVAAAAAAITALGAVVAVVTSSIDSGVSGPEALTPALADELIADHMRYAPQDMPAEVASADPAVVRAFFTDKVAFEPAVPTLKSTRLLGGRLCTIEGRKVQLLFYEQGHRRLSLYVSDHPTPLADDCQGEAPHHACGRRTRGLMLTLVGDAPRDEVRRLLADAYW